MAVDGALRLTEVRGFVFDVDGTLVHRSSDFRAHPVPGAVEVLDRIRRSGRRLVLFTNGSHVPAEQIARALTEDGLPVADTEVLTRRERDHVPAPLPPAEPGVSVFHRCVRRGAPLLTASYVPGFAGANGIVLSRGAMITAAIAKVSGTRPKVVGKPSRAAVGELRTHFKGPTQKLAVVGDDLSVDVRLGRMGTSHTILVRSGTSGEIDLDRLPARLRPDAVIDTVADLLDSL